VPAAAAAPIEPAAAEPAEAALPAFAESAAVPLVATDVPAIVTDTIPAPLTQPGAIDNDISSVDSRFNPLGVAELKPLGDLPADLPRGATQVRDTALEDDDAIDAVDAVDAELFPIFEEEAEELLPQLASKLRDWARKPQDANPPAACMRTLHTLKGGARLAGAMRLGEMAHRLETRIEHLLAHPPVEVSAVEDLQSYGDSLTRTFEALRERDARDQSSAAEALAVAVAATPIEEPADAPPVAALLAPAPQPPAVPPAPIAPLQVLLQDAPPTVSDSAHQRLDGAAHPDDVPTQPADLDTMPALVPGHPAPDAPLAPRSADAARGEPAEVDWSRFSNVAAATVAARKSTDRAQGAQSAVRVRAPLLDRLVNLAGEVSITRSRAESGVAQIKSSLGDLTENLERLRAQLRDIEFHGETQMSSRLEAAKAASQSFDPLEFDRFTRFQELTRMMA